MSYKFILVEGQQPIRDDVQSLLDERFSGLQIDSFSSSDCHDQYSDIGWQDYDLVLINCPYAFEESFNKLSGLKQLSPPPMVLVLTKALPIAEQALTAGADNVFLYEDSLSDLASKVENLLELKQSLHLFPFSLDDYHLHEVIHDTENAIIYRATYKKDLSVAVKRFKYNLSELEPKFIHQLKMDLNDSVSLKHAGLVNFITSGISDHAFYLTMEYVEGGDLKSILDTHGTPPLRQALGWFREIVTAVSMIHRWGMLHRDLKTSNILLKDDGTLALTDYGVEKQLLIAVGSLTEDEIFCTPYYVSPERVIGERCTAASDVYSLGVIFYELLTGERPFDASNLVDLLKMHVLEPIPNLPDSLQKYQPLLEKMLAKETEDRFESSDAILEALDTIEAS